MKKIVFMVSLDVIAEVRNGLKLPNSRKAPSVIVMAHSMGTFFLSTAGIS